MNGKAIVEEPGAALVSDRRSVARGFFALVASLTLVPLVGLPLALTTKDPHAAMPPLRLMLIILALTGSMHVGASAFFYTDRDFRPVISESRLRCLWSLALLPAGLLALGVLGNATIGPWALFAVFAVHNTWLFHHYQRQNFGLISLVSTNAGTGRLPRDVNVLLNVAALAGIVGALGIPGFIPANVDQVVALRLHERLHAVAVAVYALSLVLLIRALVVHPFLRRDPWLVGALLLGWAFFLPAVTFDGLGAGFLPLAVAHGAQYVVMMIVLSGRSSRGWPGLAVMAALGAGIGLGLDSMREVPALLFATGVVQVHFLLDAKVWRLREPRQRAIMTRRFDFLLAR